MVHSKPLISIGMPVYNGERFIRQTLDSLLAQDYENFELIISDNASTDGTQEICLDYAARDKRIRYFRNEMNMGAAWNYNHVFELSSGDYFMWASDDDYWDSSYLRSCLEPFDTSEAIVLAGAVCENINPETEELILIDQGFSTVGLSSSERFKLYKSTVHGGRHIGGIFYGVYKRNALREVMPAREVIATDHLILAELCLLGEFVTVQKRLMVKRWGGTSVSIGSIAGVLGINNPFLIQFPYFVREVLLQKIIFQSDRLSMAEKIKLGSWSLGNYAQFCFKRVIFMLWVLRLLPAYGKYKVKRARELLYRAARRASSRFKIEIR